MQFHFITSNPLILGRKPIIAGSGISVEIIFGMAVNRGTIEAIYQQNKQLPKGSVEEALRYAAQFSKNEILLIDEIPL